MPDAVPVLGVLAKGEYSPSDVAFESMENGVSSPRDCAARSTS